MVTRHDLVASNEYIFSLIIDLYRLRYLNNLEFCGFYFEFQLIIAKGFFGTTVKMIRRYFVQEVFRNSVYFSRDLKEKHRTEFIIP